MADNIYKPPSSELIDHSELMEAEKDDQIKVLASGFQMALYGLYLLLVSIPFIVAREYSAGVMCVVLGGGMFVFGIVIIGIGEKNSILLGLAYLLSCIIPVLGIISVVVILKRTASELRKNSYAINIWGAHKTSV